MDLSFINSIQFSRKFVLDNAFNFFEIFDASIYEYLLLLLSVKAIA